MSLLNYLAVATVRHPTKEEQLPEWSMCGIQLPKLDRSWVWLATSGYEIQGVLIAAPCHGFAYLLRIVLALGVPSTVLRELLRTAAREVRGRGYEYYMLVANPHRSEEYRILKAARHFGAIEGAEPHVLAMGRIPEGL